MYVFAQCQTELFEAEAILNGTKVKHGLSAGRDLWYHSNMNNKECSKDSKGL